jgi:WD40 repeat protein
VWDVISDGNGNVREWAHVQEMITAVAFSPDGDIVAAGLMKGRVFFYEYEGMK